MPRPCSFHVKELDRCQNGYCYYPSQTKEIECTARAYMIARYGNWELRYKPSFTGNKP
jgi:hypothetical protein